MSTKDNWKGRIQKFRELGHEITPAIEKIIEAEKELSREEGYRQGVIDDGRHNEEYIIPKKVEEARREIVEALYKRQKLFSFIPQDKFRYKMVKSSDLDILSLITKLKEKE